MRNIIKKLLNKKLNELTVGLITIDINEVQINPKPIYNSGASHKIYQSSSNPDRLFKVGDENIVSKWYNLFKKYPKLFPRVFRSGKEKDNNYYVEVEKLNTERVNSEWNLLTDSLDNIGLIDKENHDNIDRVFREALSDEEYENSITPMILKYDKKIYKLFINWINFLHSVNQVSEPIKGNMLDVHRGNFGYDSNGKMKCLDI